MRARHAILLALVVLAAMGAWLLHTGSIRIPDRFNPWAPLKIAEPPGLLTRIKLERIERDAALCRTVLREADMRYVELPDREVAPGCGFRNAVRIDATTTAVGTPFALSCRSAVALALWERHVLQPAAQAHFGQRITRLQHLGSYACRNVYGRDEGARSRHATADALDVAGFVLADGHRIRVLGGWAGDEREDRFLRTIHAGACRVFDSVLGPDYNAAHRDHLHLDRGGYRVCR